MSKSLKIILTVVGVGLAVGLAEWLYLQENGGRLGNSNGNSSINFKTVSEIKVINGLLPQGFPSDVPVVGTIGQVSKFAFDNGYEYTINSTSPKSRDELWQMYNDYMVKAGYSLMYGTDKTKGTVIGKKGNESMMVVISVRNKLSYILLTLVTRS